MVAQALPSLHQDPLFADERRLHEETARFLDFATRVAAEPLLRAQLKPILNVSGKRVRPLLPFWLARTAGQAQRDDVARIAAVTLALHSAAIVIDDIEDGSSERQAQTALHLRQGLAPTLNSASLLIFASLQYLHEPALMRSAVDAIAACHVGQALDLAFADAEVADALFDAPAALRQERWLACTRGKTAVLMEWPVRAAAEALGFAPAVVAALAEAVVQYAFGYQILDDVKNFRPDLVGNKAYEDVPTGLRNWVCLELLAELDDAELARTRSLYGTDAFTAFVCGHARLPDAIARARRAALSRIDAARAALERLSDGREGGYLAELLDRPLEDLRHG